MMIKKRNIFAWLTAPILFLAAACTDEVKFEENKETAGGDGVITISFNPESQAAATRAGESVVSSHISDGKKVDYFVFAVYQSATVGGIYTRADEFQKSDKPVTLKNGNTVTPGAGQNIIEIDQDDPNFWPFQLQLVVDPDKYYKVVAWAQYSGCEAYDPSDLTNVKVKYRDPDDMQLYESDFGLNNYDYNDAFCGVSRTPFKGDNTQPQEVRLHRPFAQINVGTAGWDYEASALLNPNKVKYMWSKIIVKNVAQFYNALESKAITKDANQQSLLTDAYFVYNTLPAFYHYTNTEDIKEAPATYVFFDEETGYPADELLTVKRGVFADIDYVFNKKRGDFYDYLSWHRFFNFKSGQSDDPEDSGYIEDDNFFGKYYKIIEEDEKEKIIEVELEEGEDLADHPDYLTTVQLYQYINSKGEAEPKTISTEMFKYMSMCYVLVPEGLTDDGKVTGGLVDVEFRFKGNVYISETDTDGTIKEIANGSEKETEWFDIPNVPVQKNWRTNIISDGLFTHGQEFRLYVIPDYCGGYDIVYDDSNTWDWSPDLDIYGDPVEGFGPYYYDDYNTGGKFHDDYYGTED